MTARHTPGPWVVNPFCAQVDCGVESKIGGLLPVCQMLWPTDERSEAETQANAHLIAAAPLLLEALQEAVARYGKPGGPWNVPSDPGGWISRAKDALAAAGLEGAEA